MNDPGQHILLYTHKTTPRVKYIFNLLLKDLLGLEFRITNSIEEFTFSEGIKISYTNKEISSPFHIQSAGLLFEPGIKEQTIQMHRDSDYFKYFFKTYAGQVPFDMPAAAFYLVSRYEEYLPHKPDQFNRFEAKSSLAYQEDFLDRPLVNIWVHELEKQLRLVYPQLKTTHPTYTYLSTIDIDNAYQYKQKGIMRSLGGYLTDLVRLDRNDFFQRTKVLLNKIPDPFDSYEYQLSIQEKYKIKVIYFFLLGDYGVNDKNHPSNNPDFQSLIKHLADYARIGIHPSFGSNGNPAQVKIEVSRLSRITHREITRSRQHFSMLKFPDTYATLLELGVMNDYSMGYANYNGFRASICQPFYWYDLDDELETGLKVHPYMLSEVTLRYKHAATIEDAAEIARPYIDDVKKYHGELITVFHNDTMGTATEWQNWYRVYEDIVKLAAVC